MGQGGFVQRLFIFIILSSLLGCAGTKNISKDIDHVDEGQISKLEKKVRTDPNDFQSFYQLGQLYAFKGDTLGSISYLDSALAVRANYSEARFLKASLLFNRDRTKDAFEQYILLMEQDTSGLIVKRIGGTIGVLYSMRQVLKTRTDEANPSYDLSGEKIVFQSNRNNNWDIFTMNPSGGDIVQITKSSLNDEAPIFSSDENIYFTRQQSANGLQRDIYSFNIASQSENPAVVHPSDDWYPAFDKTTNSLFFVSDRENEGNDKSKIFKQNSVSKEIFPVLVSEFDYSSPWVHPFKSEFLFTMKNNENYALFQSKIDGGEIRQLSKKAINFGGPKFSPDGKRIIFFCKNKNNFDVFENNLETDEITRLTGHPGSDLSPSYSPDGKKVIFYSNRSGKYQIYELNLERPFSRAQLLDYLRLAVRENKFY
jgi:Tol biopolymer transport system component